MNNFLGTIFNPPTIYLVDGVVREKTIQDISSAADHAFLVTEIALGDLYGISDSTYNISRYHQSIASSVGNMHLSSHEGPTGIVFTDNEESFAVGTGNAEGKSSVVLSLIPDNVDNVTISDLSTSFNRVESLNLLAAEGDFFVDGRLIQFFAPLSAPTTVTYDGIYPDFGDSQTGYFPNVIPNPNLVDSLVIAKPALASLGSKRYRITVPNTTMQNAIGEEFPQTLDIELNSGISSFVDAGGAVECPLDLVSIWKKDIGTGTYKKINANSIYIISNYIYEFHTDDSMSVMDDVCVVSLSNVSISEMLSDLYKEFRSHTHNRHELTAPVSHYSLEDNELNSHKQYLHRNGNISGYEYNVMDGSILFANESTGIEFGNEGVSIKYDIVSVLPDVINVLFANTGGGGFNIMTAYNSNQYGHLYIDGHTIKREDTTSNLIVDTFAGSGTIKFTSANTDTAKIEVNKIETELATVLDTLTIGGVLFTNSSEDVLVTSVDENDITVETKLVARDLHGKMFIDRNAGIEEFGIYFGETEISTNPVIYSESIDPDDLNEVDVLAVIESTTPITFRSNGVDTGIAIDTINNGDRRKLFNIFASPVNGSNNDVNNNIYLETQTDSEFFFIHPSQVGMSELPDRLRANIHAKIGRYSKGIEVSTADIDDKNGVVFLTANGVVNDGTIYVTGSEGECPPGIMVIESQNGVIFSDLSSGVTDCKNVKYAEVTMGELQVYGSIIATDEISCGKDIKTAANIIAKSGDFSGSLDVAGDLSVQGTFSSEGDARMLGETTFSASAWFRDDANFSAGLTTSTLDVSGAAKFESSAEFTKNLTVTGNTVLSGTLSIAKDTRIDGELSVKDAEVSDLSVTRTITCSGIATIGTLVVSSNGTMEGSLTVNRTLELLGNLLGETSTATFNKLRVLDDAEVEKDFYVEGETILRGDVSIGTSITDNLLILGGVKTSGGDFEINGKLSCFQTVSVSGKLTVSSELDVQAKANITGSLTVGGTIVFGDSGFIISEHGLVMSGATFEENVSIDKDLHIKGTTFADGDMFVKENFSTGGFFRATGGLIAGEESISSLGDIRITGRIVQTATDKASTIAGDIVVSGEAKFNSSANILGEIVIGLKQAENRITMNSNHLRVFGDTGKITVTNMSVGKIIGSSDLNLQPHIEDVINNNDINIGSQDGEWLELGKTYFGESVVFDKTIISDSVLYVRSIKSADRDIEFIDISAKECYYA